MTNNNFEICENLRVGSNSSRIVEEIDWDELECHEEMHLNELQDQVAGAMVRGLYKEREKNEKIEMNTLEKETDKIKDMEYLHDTPEIEENDEVFMDDISGSVLNGKLVRTARDEELKEFEKLQVWKWVPVSECVRVTGKRPIGTRWVDVNKGDNQEPDVRSRLVAQEYKGGSSSSVAMFAAMPPLEAKKMLFSLAASARHRSGRPYKIGFIDVKKAYLYAKSTRPTYVRLPPEEKAPEGMCGLLQVSLYGTRDAAANWEAEYSQTLKNAGFCQGASSPCIFRHEAMDATVVVHGDDFTILSDGDGVAKVEKIMSDKYTIKLRGVMGPEKGDCKEIRILNRLLRYTEFGVEIEADPRHAEIIVRDMGMKDAKALGTPGIKHEIEDEIWKKPLPPDRVRMYRGLVARANYLSQDRVDIQYSVKELARGMSGPTEGHWYALKRLARYLKGKSRVVIKYEFQDLPEVLRTFADSDWAGCRATRKSTSGGMMMFGCHLIKGWAGTQSVIALSSGEAEYYSLVRAVCESLECSSMMKDMGRSVKIDTFTDSSATLGICSRKGLGKLRHIDTQLLWLHSGSPQEASRYD